MVIVPVVATLATAEPLIIPISAEASTATFAGPPGERPTSVSAISLINWEKPEYLRKAPKSTNTKIYVAETLAPVPRMPPVSQTSALMTRLNVNELAEALRPAVVQGMTLRVRITKEGKEPGQGVAHLEDGTMVVIENGKDRIGEDADVTVTSVLQTSSGRMIFAKLN